MYILIPDIFLVPVRYAKEDILYTKNTGILQQWNYDNSFAKEAAIKLVSGEAIKINKTINNGKIDVPSILVIPIAIDKNNIDSVLIYSGYLKKEDIYKKE